MTLSESDQTNPRDLDCSRISRVFCYFTKSSTLMNTTKGSNFIIQLITPTRERFLSTIKVIL